MKLLRSPLNMVPAKSGEFEIATKTFPAGHEFDVVSMRQAILEGRRPEKCVYDAPITIHSLRQGGSLLMSDAPIELAMMGEFVQRAKGRVLIGGLGLSLVTRIVAAKPQVKLIDVVEIEQDVINLTGHDIPKTRVIRADLFASLLNLSEWPYNVAFFDIWYPTGESTWVEFVAPLRRIVQNRFGTRSVKCWGEPEMIGQMVRALSHQSTGSLEQSAWSPAHYAFRRATIDKYPAIPDGGRFSVEQLQGSEALIHTDPYFRDMLGLFLGKVGTQKWEKTFGVYWDEGERLRKERRESRVGTA